MQIFFESESVLHTVTGIFTTLKTMKIKMIMNKVIKAAKEMNSQNYKALEKRKVMDLSF